MKPPRSPMSPAQIIRRSAALALCALAAGTSVASAATQPMPATVAPQNPFMAANPGSNIHNDTWMADSYQQPGPLGRNLQTKTGATKPSLCGSLAFDKAGQIVSICPSSLAAPQARVFDPKTLETLPTYDMPDAPNPAGTKFFQNFTGGGYFFLDGSDRIWSATKTSHLMALAIRDNGHKL